MRLALRPSWAMWAVFRGTGLVLIDSKNSRLNVIEGRQKLRWSPRSRSSQKEIVFAMVARVLHGAILRPAAEDDVGTCDVVDLVGHDAGVFTADRHPNTAQEIPERLGQVDLAALGPDGLRGDVVQNKPGSRSPGDSCWRQRTRRARIHPPAGSHDQRHPPVMLHVFPPFDPGLRQEALHQDGMAEPDVVENFVIQVEFRLPSRRCPGTRDQLLATLAGEVREGSVLTSLGDVAAGVGSA